MIRRLILCMAAAGLVTGIPVQAAIDGVEAARNSAGMALRWENIQGAPYWLSGPAPSSSTQRGWHAVDLKGNQGVALHVPARAMLRIIAEQEGAQQAPQVGISDGTGLALEHAPIPGADGRSWLVRNDAAHAVVIHLQRAGQTDTPQRLALFLGTMAPPAGAAVYRHALPLKGEHVRVREASEALAQTYVRMAANEEFAITVRGPDRLMIEYRLEAMQSAGAAALTMHAGWDDQPMRLIHQVTAPENDIPLRIDGAWQRAGRLERVALDIPDGEHRLRLHSSHGVLLRAAKEGTHDFLLPSLNIPQAWRHAGSFAALEELEQNSIAAGVSNQWRDIGALAAQRLQREASRQTGQSKLRDTADELHGALTQYRDLLPSGPGDLQARSVVRRAAQSPDGTQRNRIAAPESAADHLPAALFHPIGDTPVRFALPQVPYPMRLRALVPADAPEARIEIRYDNGQTDTLWFGMPALAADKLRPPATALADMQGDGWPPTLGGHASRSGTAAIQANVASMEWQVPANVKSLSIRAVGGIVPVALQWAESAEYALDDQYLAQLVQQPAPGNPAASLKQAALKTLQRMLAAAHAQFTANVVPPGMPSGKLDDAQARKAAQAAQQESEPARAVELWQQAMQTEDAALQSQALRGLTDALFLAGERFTAERLLRSHWNSGHPALARAAEDELDALYAREGDREMQSLFAAARAANDASYLPRLSVTLAAEGNDDMALLAGLVSRQRDLTALLQCALRSKKWKTFDALLQQLDTPREHAYWQAQRALSLGRLDEADHHFKESGAQEWSNALAEGQSISRSLADETGERAAAVQAWLEWQAKHPGARLWQDQPDVLLRHGGGISLRSLALNRRSSWWRATAEHPLVTRVVGPARLRVEARPLHARGDALASGWLRVKTRDQLWLQAFYQNQPATGLELETQDAWPGASVVREINLPAGLHELHIDAGAVPVAARLQVERPALQLPVLPAPAAAHFESHTYHAGRREAAPACGHRGGCELLVDGSLHAYRIAYEPVYWRALPAPAGERDPVAGLLSDNDIDGALNAAADPVERMRLLLWLAETRPSQRTRAVVEGAALAKAHAGRELQAQWNQLAAGSLWSALPLVDRSAGLRPVATAQGTPESPAARIRAALLAPLREGEVRVGAGTRATLRSDAPSPGTLNVELTSDEMPWNLVMPMQVTVERNGRPVRTVEVDQAMGTVSIPVPIPAGEQHVSVSLPRGFSNQYLRVRFSGARQGVPQVTRDWHIATRSQPVQATVSGPAWIRIDRLDHDGVRSEERLVTEPVSTLVLPPHAGAGESLYRLYQLRIDPAPPVPPLPRPDHYTPARVPEAPAEWLAAIVPPPQRVRFIDSVPLEGQRNSTLSARTAFQRRRDIEASGAMDDPVAERFVEAGVTWRQRDEATALSKLADVFVRNREAGSPVFGFRLRAEQDVRWLAALPMPFTFTASLSGFAQDTPDKMGASLSFNASVSQTQRLTSTLSHTPVLEFTARTMNLDSVRDRRLVDTDVFSPYRQQQKRALTIGDTLSWRPWRDAYLAAGISVTTKPDFNLTDVDNHQASIQWRQLVGPLSLDIGARATRYWASPDRPRELTRREIRLGVGRDWWLNTGSRIEVRAELRRDLDAATSWGGVELRWHWGPGRQLRDFSARELDFSALRNWHMPAPANRIEEER